MVGKIKKSSKKEEMFRQIMVQEQIVKRGITDARVISALEKVPRHKFIDQKFLSQGYEDCPLPIGAGQTISQPYMVALMTQCLELTGREKVLEIGLGSGYQAAILAELAEEVYSVERLIDLAEKAQKVLSQLKYDNIRVKTGDGSLGWEEASPFEGIIVTAGAPDVPSSLINQLAEGGRLVIPVGGKFMQTLFVVRKEKDRIIRKEICSCVFVPLIGREAWEH